MEVLRQSGAGGGAAETGLRWRRESQWTPNAESIFAVNCFCRVRGLARFEGRALSVGAGGDISRQNRIK